MLFDEGDDKMVKTEAFPTIRMKIDRLLKITNEYQFNDLVKAVYCINLCINNRSVLESCLALNACLIEYEEKGSKRIGTYDEFKGFFGKIYDVMKPGICIVSRIDFLMNIRKMRSSKEELIIYVRMLIK